jgi:hypothetical protein
MKNFLLVFVGICLGLLIAGGVYFAYEVLKTNDRIEQEQSPQQVIYSMKVNKGDLVYELVGPNLATDGGGNNLNIRNIKTGGISKPKYWLRFSDKISTIGDNSFILIGAYDDVENNGIVRVVMLTQSGIEEKVITLPVGLTAIEQFLCEMGCRRGVNWKIDFDQGLPILILRLYAPKTYEELVTQYKSIKSKSGVQGSKEVIDDKMRELNYVRDYKVKLPL